MCKCFLKFIVVLFISLFILVSCESWGIPKGRILVKNTSQDRTFNVVRVEAKGRTYILKPNQSVLLDKGTWRINFSRKYKDHTKRYTVHCPKHIKGGILIKLIDVHLNRMPQGCKTVSASR